MENMDNDKSVHNLELNSIEMYEYSISRSALGYSGNGI